MFPFPADPLLLHCHVLSILTNSPYIPFMFHKITEDRENNICLFYYSFCAKSIWCSLFLQTARHLLASPVGEKYRISPWFQRLGELRFTVKTMIYPHYLQYVSMPKFRRYYNLHRFMWTTTCTVIWWEWQYGQGYLILTICPMMCQALETGTPQSKPVLSLFHSPFLHCPFKRSPWKFPF